MNYCLRPAAQSFYDMIEGLAVKTHSYILTVLRVTFKNSKTSYLTHRHAAHTGVQYARPCIGAHFTDEWEPLLPVDTVEMDRLPLEGNKQPFTEEGKHQCIVLSGFLNVLQSSRRWKMNFDAVQWSWVNSLQLDTKIWGWSRQAVFTL